MGETTVPHFPLYCGEVETSASPLCELMLTPHCQLEPILSDPCPSFKQPLLLHSPQLGSLFLNRARLGVGECFVGQIKEPK